MRFFFDNCISPKLARAMRELIKPDHEVTPLVDKVPASTLDVEWIPRLGIDGDWVVVTGDLRIKKKPQERLVWKAAKLTTFFMADSFTNVPDWEQVRWIIDKWPLIVDQAKLVSPGAAFLVPRRSGKLESIAV